MPRSWHLHHRSSLLSLADRIRNPALHSRIMSAEQAAALIPHGANVGMSGFTGAGYPKALPQALARRIEALHAAGEQFRIGLWTGASTAPELDGALAKVDGIEKRLPFQSDPICRQKINSGQMHFTDMHLSHVAQHAWFGFLGHLDVAVIEVVGILPDGRLIPSMAVGNNKTWLDLADKVIIEVNTLQPEALEGMHDVYYGTDLPPHRKPIPLVQPNDRIGEPYLRCDPSKIVAIVGAHQADRNTTFAAPDAISQRIAGHIIEFFQHEVKLGRLPAHLLPLQSGVGNVANAVLAGLNDGPFTGLTGFTEVLQDGMLDLLRSGKMVSASATSISLSTAALADFTSHLDFYRQRIVLRPQEISNHPELVRRLGIIAGYLSIFVTPSLAKGGTISSIVPMVSHVDHTEHDVQIIVTEHGLADLRGLSPRQRAQLIIDQCAHPDYRDALRDYTERAWRDGPGRHTPHLLDEALAWHTRYLQTGSMQTAPAA